MAANSNRRMRENLVTSESPTNPMTPARAKSVPETRPRHAPPSLLRTFLATITGNLYLLFGTIFFSVVSILVAPIPPRGDWTNRAARLWAKGLLAASWIRLDVRHAPSTGELPGAPERSVIVANHQSLFDIPALLAAIPGQSRFVAKSSLFKIPIFGWAMALGGFIPVDRKDRSTARDSFASALDRLARGASVVLFPEEARSLDGRLQPFRRGGFLMALKSGLPIVPVGVHGALAVQSRRSFLIRPRTVTVSFGEVVPLAGRSIRDLKAITAEVREQVAALAGTECSDPGDAE